MDRNRKAVAYKISLSPCTSGSSQGCLGEYSREGGGKGRGEENKFQSRQEGSLHAVARYPDPSPVPPNPNPVAVGDGGTGADGHPNCHSG